MCQLFLLITGLSEFPVIKAEYDLHFPRVGDFSLPK